MILGLDMSSQKSGYSLFDNERLIDYGLWKLSFEDESNWRKRINYMAHNLNYYCKEHKINKIFCEDVPLVMDNTQTIKILSALQGCIITVCDINNLEVEFVPVSWKNDIGINLSHSSQNKQFQKLHKDESLSKFKENVKAYEKKMSVDYTNKLFGIDLIWKSKTSKFNMDDISDSINIVVSKTFKNIEKYNIDTFENIIQTLYEETKEKDKKGFGKKVTIK